MSDCPAYMDRVCFSSDESGIQLFPEQAQSDRRVRQPTPVRVVCLETLSPRIFRGLTSNRKYWWVRATRESMYTDPTFRNGFLHGNVHPCNNRFDMDLTLCPGVVYTLGCGTAENGIRKHFMITGKDNEGRYVPQLLPFHWANIIFA
jgi:hypothetical protein